MRIGKGHLWAVWDHNSIPRLGNPYIKRLRIVQTPLFGVFLHRHEGPDQGSTLHNHPWPFISFVLRGSYVESTPRRPRLIRFVNCKPLGGRHRITYLCRVPTYTLVFVGPRMRRWSFK